MTIRRLFASTVLSVMAVTCMLQASANADSIGTIDLDKVVSSYNKAQSLMADIKVKEAELRKMQADFSKQLEDSKKNKPKNPVSNDQLEKDLNAKLNAKLTEYRDWTTQKQKEIDTDLESTISEVAKSKGVDVVLSKQAVFRGGTEITNDVINRLNAKTAN